MPEELSCARYLSYYKELYVDKSDALKIEIKKQEEGSPNFKFIPKIKPALYNTKHGKEERDRDGKHL